MQHLRWLLVTALPRYSKVSWGTCSLILRLHVLSILIKNFHETSHKQFFTNTWQNNLFVTWIDCSHTFDCRMFWENINCFRFWWKNYTKLCTSMSNIMCRKNFFPCTLRFVRCFGFQGMILKTGHSGENPDFDFVPLLFTLLT